MRKNRLFFLGLTIVLLVALTYTAWVSGLTSRWFYIHEVQITGGERADLHSLDSLIEAYHGQSLFSHDARPLGDAVMALPWVKGVAIGPVFPGKLRLSVDEHQPLYSLWSGKEWYIFCKHGKRLPLHRNQDLGLLPQLAVEANNSGHNTPLENDPLAMEVHEFIVLLHEKYSVAYSYTAKIAVANNGRLELLWLADGGRLQLSLGNAASELRKLETFLSTTGRLVMLQQHEYVNLRFANRVILGRRKV